LRAARGVEIDHNPAEKQQEETCIEAQKSQRPEAKQNNGQDEKQDGTPTSLSKEKLPCSGHEGGKQSSEEMTFRLTGGLHGRP